MDIDINKDHTEFLNLVQDHFERLNFQSSYDYHHWYTSLTDVIEELKDYSFPKIENLVKLTKLPDKLLVMSCTDTVKGIFYGTAILKYEDPFTLQLICFMVDPLAKRQGVGADMLKAIEALARSFNVSSLHVRYRTYWSDNEVWEKMLDQHQYEPSDTLLWYVSMPDANVQHSKEWLKKSAFGAPYYVEDWNNTSYQQLEQALGSDLWKGLVRRSLSPFQYQQLLLPHVSFLLKKDNILVGWLVCHLISKDVVQCSSLFVHPTEAKGQGLKMAAEAIKRRKLGARVVFSIEKGNEPMLNLTNKYIAGGKAQLFENRVRKKHL